MLKYHMVFQNITPIYEMHWQSYISLKHVPMYNIMYYCNTLTSPVYKSLLKLSGVSMLFAYWQFLVNLQSFFQLRVYVPDAF